MPKISYQSHDGTVADVNAPENMSVMQVAKANGVDGIVAECGGSAMCATCHVYVAEDFLDRLPVMNAVEDEMLDCTATERKPSSRLSCQIKLTPDLDGIVIHVPERQT
ncbi:2Fe-2S iron-sulfur cluster-binding protein [Bradyrhizobium mercantei]|uniref:2Fe-2S iron-sulfur cluster-binding protein n=1 Tax=Bradyrhizobium mercantei TaxID=1904807 RepID=UPI0009766652|nr:2Fe-2S iron-sulfur cluster-binding protein [Bradyrhizobium mercantei]